MAEVAVNGVRLHVQRLSEGDPTIVFIHGMVIDNLASFYYTLANPLATSAGVILYDQRGHGMSERPRTGYSIADSVRDLTALLDSLGVEGPVHLVGNSYGGTVALATAMAHPERVAGMALIEAHFAVAGWGGKMAGSIELVGLHLEEEELQAWLDENGGRKLNRMARNAEALIYGTSMADDLRASPPFTEKDLAGIRCPTLAIYGEDSDVIACSRELQRLLPRCDLRILPEATHSVLLENTAEVRRLLIDFFLKPREA